MERWEEEDKSQNIDSCPENIKDATSLPWQLGRNLVLPDFRKSFKGGLLVNFKKKMTAKQNFTMFLQLAGFYLSRFDFIWEVFTLREILNTYIRNLFNSGWEYASFLSFSGVCRDF